MTGQLVRFEPRATLRVPNLTRGTLHPHAAVALRERRPDRERLPFAIPPRRSRRERGITWEEFWTIVPISALLGLLVAWAF